MYLTEENINSWATLAEVNFYDPSNEVGGSYVFALSVRPPSVRPSVWAVDGLCFVQRTCPRGLRFRT